MDPDAITAMESLRNLEKVQRINRSAYSSFASQYHDTGAERLRHAKWLDPLRRVVGQFPYKPSVLEVGCAEGAIANYLASMGCDVTAIDFSCDMISLAKQRFPSVDFLCADFIKWMTEGRRYDIVMMLSFLHVLPPPWDRVALKKAADLTAENGLVYLSTTLHTSHESKGLAIKVMGNVRRLRYRNYYTKSTLWALINSCGLEVVFYSISEDWRQNGKSWVDVFCRKVAEATEG